MKRVFLAVLFLLVVAGVPTAAYAIKAEIYVTAPGFNSGDRTLVAQTVEVATPLAGDNLASSSCSIPNQRTCSCSSSTGPCTVTVTTPIPASDLTPLSILPGAFAEATVQTNKNTIGTSTSVTTFINVSGTFRYIGPAPAEGDPGATIEFVTSNTFALPTGVWTTASKGGFKCKRTTSTTVNPTTYVPASCTLSSSTVQSGTCTLCRAFCYTD